MVAIVGCVQGDCSAAGSAATTLFAGRLSQAALQFPPPLSYDRYLDDC
jgi:hypothetical protein